MEIKLLKTFDLELSATLYTLGFPIKGIYPIPNSNKMEFYFDETEKLKQTISDYHSRSLRVEPTELFWSRREILTRMKNESHNQKSF